MNGPLVLTDKETILVLRARIMELETEVRAWQAFGKESAATAEEAKQVAILRPVLRRADRQAGGLATAHVLVLLIDHPGRPISRERLYACCQAVSGLGAHEDGRALAVRVSRLRAALAHLGFDDVIQYQQGSGWMIAQADAIRIKIALLPEFYRPTGDVSDH